MSLIQPVDGMRRLWRMAALRQAAISTAVFLGVVALAWAGSFWIVREALIDRVDQALRLEHDTLSRIIGESGPTRALLSSSEERFATFRDEDGRIHGLGDARLFRRQGLATLMAGDEEEEYEDQWRVLIAPMPGGVLAIGTNLDDTSEILEILNGAFLLTWLAAMSATLISGGVLGFHAQRRILRINDALAAIAKGDLSARVAPRRDRDDLDHLALRLDETTARLQTLMQQTRDLSANIAHDLRTPIARLRARLEDAVAARGSGDIDKALESALGQADEVADIFNAIMRIARVDSGESRAAFTPVDLAAVIEQVSETFGPVVEDSGRTLDVDVSGASTVMGDQDLLVQLLANLIQNAIRHTPPGSAITLLGRRHMIGIADDGPGIPPDDRQRVLEPMYRLEKSRQNEGAGLGLALVRAIADLHGAELSLQDNPTASGAGPGLRVEIDLPG